MLSARNAVIILAGLRFPENAGMIARACANMGCRRLRLVAPERFRLLSAWPLAARIGRPVLEGAEIFDNLSDAVKDLHVLFGTSARTGARRRAITPEELAALKVNLEPGGGEEPLFGILFGPEDRGLSNSELALCRDIVRIPAAEKASSLNIAQAALIILYELSKNGGSGGKTKAPRGEKPLLTGDLERLENELKDVLIRISAIPERDSDYFFRQWHELLSRALLRRNEHDAIMGMCRRIKNILNKA